MNQSQRIDDFVLEKVIGLGATNQVFQAHRVGNVSKKYAIKLISEDSMATRDINTSIMLHEAEVLQRFDHKNIVKFELGKADGLLVIGELDFKEPYIVLELAEKGVLIDYLIFTGFLSEDISRYYFKQLIEGIKHIHSKSYVHRDIKTENLLLNSEFDLLISDFGHCSTLKNGSLEMEGEDSNWRGIGTAKYNPPEASNIQFKETSSVDIFMAGVVLFVMVFGEAPFKKGALRDDHHYQHFFDGNPQRFWSSHAQNIRTFVSDSVIDLITGMLALEPSQRLSIADIEAHPWFSATLPTKEAVSKEMQIRLDRCIKQNKQKK